MGTTRTEKAIDELQPLGDDAEFLCDDIRLAWLAREMLGDAGGDFDSIWSDR